MTARIGHYHQWNYRSNWREKKVSPGRWLFNTKQLKSRVGKRARYFQGLPIGSRITWRIKAIQRLWKVTPNKYAGYMRGVKRFAGVR